MSVVIYAIPYDRSVSCRRSIRSSLASNGSHFPVATQAGQTNFMHMKQRPPMSSGFCFGGTNTTRPS